MSGACDDHSFAGMRCSRLEKIHGHGEGNEVFLDIIDFYLRLAAVSLRTVAKRMRPEQSSNHAKSIASFWT